MPEGEVEVIAKEIVDSLSARVQFANNMVVNCHDDHVKANQFVSKDLNPLIKKIKAYHKPFKDAAKNTLDIAKDREKEQLDQAESAKDITKDKINKFLDAEDARIKKETAELAEKARKERERLLASAQKKIERATSTHAKLEDQITALQEELDKTPDDIEKEPIIAQIEKLQQKQTHASEKIEEVVQETEVADQAPSQVVPEAAPKVAGQSSKKVKVPDKDRADKMAVIKAVVAGEASPDLLDINFGVAKKLLNSGVFPPGIPFYEERDTRIR